VMACGMPWTRTRYAEGSVAPERRAMGNLVNG
jgi:hypothetical protein